MIVSGPGGDVLRVKIVEVSGSQIEAGNSTEHFVRADEPKIADSVIDPTLLQFDGDLSLDVGSGSTITDSSLIVPDDINQSVMKISIVNSSNRRYKAEIEARGGSAATINVMTLAVASRGLKGIWDVIVKKTFPLPIFKIFQKSFENKIEKHAENLTHHNDNPWHLDFP